MYFIYITGVIDIKNEWIIEDNVVKVFASRKGKTYKVLFDEEDLSFLLTLKNTLRVDRDGYLTYQFWQDGRNITKFLHRIIMGEPKGLLVDHINGRNRSKRTKVTQSGYRNVYYMKAKGKYQVRLKVNGKTKSFGYYKDLESAKKAAYEARLHTFGEFAGEAV